MARRKKDDDDDVRIDPFEAGGNDAAEYLINAIEQMEGNIAEIQEKQDENREIMKELGGRGYDTKQVRRVMAAKKAIRLNREKWVADESVFHTYLRAIGIEPDSEY